MPEPDYRLPEPPSTFAVSRHARDRLRERFPQTRDWPEDTIARVLYALLAQWRRIRLDGIYALDMAGSKVFASVRAGVVVTVMTEAEHRGPRIARPLDTSAGQERVKEHRRQSARDRAARRAERLAARSEQDRD